MQDLLNGFMIVGSIFFMILIIYIIFKMISSSKEENEAYKKELTDKLAEKDSIRKAWDKFIGHDK